MRSGKEVAALLFLTFETGRRIARDNETDGTDVVVLDQRSVDGPWTVSLKTFDEENCKRSARKMCDHLRFN